MASKNWRSARKRVLSLDQYGEKLLDCPEFLHSLKIVNMSKKVKVPFKEWRWDETDHGHKGVFAAKGKLTWFDHAYNPHAGGHASDQTFKSFLEGTDRLNEFTDNITCSVRDYLLGYYPEYLNEHDKQRRRRVEESKTWKEHTVLESFSELSGLNTEYDYRVYVYETHIRWWLEINENSSMVSEERRSIEIFLKEGCPPGFGKVFEKELRDYFASKL